MATPLSTYSIGAGAINRVRAPCGYRIVQWADGFYHVYLGGECLCEVLTRKAAVRYAYSHRAAQQKRCHTENKE